VPLWIVGVNANEDVGRNEIALLARSKPPHDHRDDENEGRESQPEKNAWRE
jgi:hypothetical protein